VSEERRAGSSLLGVVLDGSYRVDGLIGQGGMGAVYRATQLRLDKPVAVKVMALDPASHQEALDRFRREARVTSALGHPHIVQVFDFSTTPAGEPFLVMELLEGEDLESRLQRVRRLPLKDVVPMVKQVASALAATHAKGIVHRDLKPGNIYLLEAAGEKGFVKVVDFGISKVRSATTKLTRASAVMGTPDYMSPEQAQGNTEDIDETTDQWALACIAWECLSGQGPFVAENVPALLFKIVHQPPSSLLPKVAGLPRQVEDVLVRALAKNKADRFASVSDFAEALEAATSRAAAVVSPTLSDQTLPLAGSGTTETSPPKTTTFSRTTGELGGDTVLDQVPRKPKWVKPRWVLPAVGAAALVVVGGLLLLRSGPSRTSTGAAPSSTLPTAPAPPPAPSPTPPPAPPVEMPAEAAMPAASEPTPADAAPVPISPPPAATAETRKPQRLAGPRKGGPQDSLVPSPAAKIPAKPSSGDPFERSRLRKGNADSLEASPTRKAPATPSPSPPRLKTLPAPANQTGSPPTAPGKSGPVRKIIIKEL
jgi:eukaryotic-like serine/threonine-protein kinase